MLSLERGERGFLRLEFGGGPERTRGGLLDLVGEVLLVLCCSFRLPIELVGVRSVMYSYLGGERSRTVRRDPGRCARPLREGREREPALLRRVRLGSERIEPGLGFGHRPCQLIPACRGLGDLPRQPVPNAFGIRQFAPTGHQIVGGQSEGGVPQIGLDGLRTSCYLRLPAQRLELATQLGGQVAEPVEVALHPGEFALRLLLTPPVFEDAGGFLDERATLLRSRLQDLGEFPLAHDHVHLASDPRVGQQFLHVHQAGAIAVDLVFRSPVSEHPAGQRDLGVVDRQGPVGVVQGQRDLCATQWLPSGGPGKDHVLHLSATERLGAVFTHHPGERIHDVRLTGTIGPHHAADPGFEPQRRGRREGLEALERQRLEVHGCRS